MKTYKKVKVVAKNNPQGSYVAGCPVKGDSTGQWCKPCERTK